MHRRAQAILARLEVQIDPRATLKTLSIAQRHMVAIARALSFEAQVVILDEPTAALSQHEILEFYQIVERLKQEGKAILFISHKFDEIFELADHYTILRDGVFVGAGAINEITEERMVSMMVGRAITQTFRKSTAKRRDGAGGEKPLPSDRVCAYLVLLRKGKSSALRAGGCRAYRIDAGAFRRHAAIVRGNYPQRTARRFRQPADAIKAGIVCVPEERQKQGRLSPCRLPRTSACLSLARSIRTACCMTTVNGNWRTSTPNACK